MREWFIYVLVDPRTQDARYVGWTFNVQKRIRDHISKARRQRSHKANWLIQLERLGLRPEYMILETGFNDWAKAEQRWIRYYRSRGVDLTNLTNGGEGVVGL